MKKLNEIVKLVFSSLYFTRLFQEKSTLETKVLDRGT